MLACAYMYREQKEYGLDLARRVMDNMICRQRWSWDLPILFEGDTGRGIWGNDYAQMMVCWNLPAAIAGQDLAAYARNPDGPVQRILAVVG